MWNVKLTDVSIELQSHILSHLCTPPLFSSAPPTACTIDSINEIFEAFPDDMLHAAQASSDLSKAVIYNLGSQAKFLSCFRSRRISEWISLLENHVKAFSLKGITVLDYCEEGCQDVCGCDNLHKGVLKTLEALHTNDVSLQALNLDELILTDPFRSDEIAEHLIKAIQKSSPSLREISVQVNEAIAISMVSITVPNLEVAQISLNDYGLSHEAELLYRPINAKHLGDIFKGLNGHANHNANICKLRELRLYNIYESPIVDRQSSSSLFSAIHKLVLLSRPDSKHCEIATFIANFQNLKTLQWNTGLISPEDMTKILAGCPDLDNLDLLIGNKNILPGDIPIAQNSSGLADLLVSFRGKLKSLDTQANLSFSLIKSLGENNPNLHALKMEIDYTNVGALYLLLSTHCRWLRELRLWYSTDAVDCLGSNGWPALARAICSASDDLREISFEGDRTGVIVESATYEMVEAIIDILEFMGDRASSIEFRVPINTHNPFTVMDAISRTLNVAKTQCGSIGTLCLDYINDHFLGGYRLEYGQEDRLVDFFGLILDLEEEFSLCCGTKVDLGDIQALLEIEE